MSGELEWLDHRVASTFLQLCVLTSAFRLVRCCCCCTPGWPLFLPQKSSFVNSYRGEEAAIRGESLEAGLSLDLDLGKIPCP
jgi:hypothetical protein